MIPGASYNMIAMETIVVETDQIYKKENAMKKIVIIGANDFQKPLIIKAHEMGYETHVFAWREGATGAEDADYFYEISITEKDKILDVCRKIRPQAVATIGSDLANITVQYLAEKLGLPGNSRECIENSTNKFKMREAFARAGIWVPFFAVAGENDKISVQESGYPVIVKPTDRSGSRGITRVERKEELKSAIARATEQSFEKKAIIEEYIEGAEYSVETISYQGTHTLLAITKKYTTGNPHYIEVGHLEPAPLSPETEEKVKETVFAALSALGVENGAGHSELRIDRSGNVRIIEIGSRMGGDCIGSDLVPLSTGQDFVGMVIDVAAGTPPKIKEDPEKHISAVRFLMNRKEIHHLNRIKENYPQFIRKIVQEGDVDSAEIVDSGSRPGFYILQTDTMEEMQKLLHCGPEENPIQLFKTPVQKMRFRDERKENEETGKDKKNKENKENVFYIKRDDLLPFSFGGNKVRFAWEFVEDMKEKHCDSMIIYGNYHSNLCRILSTLCHQLEIPCYMIHNTEDISGEHDTNNSRIIHRMGVYEIRCGKSGIAEAVRTAMDELTEKGYRPYYIYGNEKGEGNEHIPMRAYEKAYEELCAWEKENHTFFDYIFLASSTNATQSGLLAGSLKHQDNRRIVGISVSRNEKRGKEVISRNIRQYAEKNGRKLPENWEENVLFTDDYMEGGYGVYSEKIAEMIRKVYDMDAVPLDMTYTGKAFYGMMEYLKKQEITGKKVLFLHTGGLPLFFDFLEDEK